jgi:glycosyltransferase involved in cell wall biosynthesis
MVLSGPSLPLTRVLHHDYPLTPQVWTVLERERFDVLVIGGWSLMATQLAIAWARLRRVPYFIVAENHLREDRPAWVRLVKSLVLRQVIPHASGSLVPGSLGREHALHYGARPESIVVFPNTIDVVAYRRASERLAKRRAEIRRRFGFQEETVVIAHVARLLAHKGARDAVEAVARARQLTESSLHLLLVGDGPLRVALEQRVRELGLTVTFAGFREGGRLLECYVTADIFALLSHRDPWGVVVNEAAAFGLPLILSDAVGAAADLLRTGENGELVRVGDVDDQARAIAALANDAGLRARYGRRSLELVEPWGYGPSVESFVSAVSAVACR